MLPQLLPVIALLAVLRFILTFNKFDDVYLLTGGGAGTEVVASGSTTSSPRSFDIGGAAAQALVLAAVPDRPAGRSTCIPRAPGGGGVTGRAPRWPRNMIETRVLRHPAAGWRSPFFVADHRVPVLLHGRCCRCVPIEEVLQNPGRLWVPPRS